MSADIALIETTKPPVNDPFRRATYRVVKGNDRVKTAEDYIREHEIALLNLLIPKHRQQAVEIVRKTALDGVKS